MDSQTVAEANLQREAHFENFNYALQHLKGRHVHAHGNHARHPSFAPED